MSQVRLQSPDIHARPPDRTGRTSAPLLACLVWLAACDEEPPELPDMGVTCQADDECETGVCGLDPSDLQADLSDATLICQPERGSVEPGEACLQGGDCRHGLCLVAGSCAAPCVSTDACGATERCAPSLSRTDDGSGLQHVSVCLARVSLGAEAEADRKLVADAVGGDTDVLELMGTDRPSIYVLQHEDDQQWPDSVSCRPPLCPIRLVSLESDGGALFAAADIGETPPRTPVALLDSVFPTTVYVGNGPQAAYSKDGYELTVTSEQPGDVSITRVRPTSDTNEDGGQLDLNVFYVGALDWRPTGARGPELLERGLEVVDGIFAQADIFIGEVRQFAVPGQLVTRGNVFDGIDDPGAGFETLKRRFGVWPELPALLALSGGAPGPGINLFFVRDIEGMGSGDVRALSGGTPGPLGMHGTGASGIAIATDMMNARPAELGRTIAHEIAHHLGLFHTSERNGDVLDPFDDTPSCTSNADRDGDGLLSASECEGAGTENLMFWANTQATALSEQQIAVLRQAMVLQR